MKKTSAFLLAMVLLLASSVWAESFDAQVISVTDGNNIQVMRQDGAWRIRLAGIESPGGDQPFGNQARQLVADLVAARQVWVDVKGRDHDNRLVSVVVADGKNVSLELIRAGLAWYDSRFYFSSSMAEAEREAKSGQIGLWGSPDSTNPRFYRQQRRGITPMTASAPCHSGSVGYGFVEASYPSDYTYIDSIGSPWGYYYGDTGYNYNYGYGYNYGYNYGCNRNYGGNYHRNYNHGANQHCNSGFQGKAHFSSVLDPGYAKSQRTVFNR